MTNTDLITNDDIEKAIQRRDDPDHPDSVSTKYIRDLLADTQLEFAEYWPEIVDSIENGHLDVLVDDDKYLVLRDMSQTEWGEWLDALHVDEEIAREVVRLSHIYAGKRLADYSAGASDLLIVEKPNDANLQHYVEAVINGLQAEGLSPGQAWSYYGVEIRGYSQSSWARRQGRDQSTVSEAFHKARNKLF